MARGRRRFPKSGRAVATRALFVEGGLLNDWQDRPRPSYSSSNAGKSKRPDGGGPSKPRGGGKKDFGPADRSLKTRQGNAFAYSYPVESSGLPGERNGLDEAVPVVLGGFGEKSAVTVFVDSRPQADPANEVPAYDYYSVEIDGPHAGLGFHGEEEADEEEVEGMEAGEGEEREMVVGFGSRSRNSEKNEKPNDGFLSIGGLRLYTEDISSPDEHSDGLDDDGDDDKEDEDGDSVEGEDADSVEGLSSRGDEEEGDSEDEASSDDYDDGSNIDEEVMEDYLEGIGGTSELLKAGWLAEDFDKHDLDSSFSGKNGNESVEKLGGIALMNASEEYGIQKSRLKNKKSDGDGRNKGFPIGGSKSTALDDLLFVKDCRTYLRKKKKNVPDFSQSWPGNAQTTKMDMRVRGEKKKHRKEMIAKKRRERMRNRGVDLEQINLKLRQMAVGEADILSFQPMHSRDCAQVQRLASIYRLRTGSQGSGKKRFVTVARTGHTCLPSSSDKLRLEKLLGLDVENDFSVNHDKTTKIPTQSRSQANIAKQMRVSYRRTGVHQSAPGKMTKNSADFYGNIREGGRKATRKQSGSSLYADKPVSFVSCGIMQVDPVAAVAIAPKESSMLEETDLGTSPGMLQEAASTAAEGSSKVGAFELHTKGFGLRMMARMGFMEGGGLGKDGQGIVEPMKAIRRPKLLGLGVQFSIDVDEKAAAGKDGDSQKNQKNWAKSSGAAARIRETTQGKRVEYRGVGTFERHTKGFGSKMMAKMGYVPGMGLGRDAQGITTPLAAVKLPKSLGLGASA